MKNIEKRFEKLIEKLKSDEFYNNRGLANEVPFYIFDYQPEDELIVRYKVKNDVLRSLEETKWNTI